MRDGARIDEIAEGRTDNPSAAPGELELVRAFVNTLDIEAGSDVFGAPAEAGAWLADHGVRPPRLGAAELKRLRTLRESIRDAVSARGADGEAAALARLNRLSGSHPLFVRLGSQGAAPLASAEPGVDGFLGRILAIVGASVVDGSWFRLKSCPNGRCRWLFYDHSRNQSRTWCSMGLCGSRAKMRTYRARHRSGVSGR
jgi:predicted RNA-binding Zn ribbon-like protein